MRDIHPKAAQGFANQTDAYVHGRPEYPDAIMPWLRNQLMLSETKSVLDLGAGTGKFSRLLQRTDAQVLAVEPVAEMRAKLRKSPELVVLDGTAEHIPLPDSSVDAVVAATAFHWFATPTALQEIRRVLRIGGWLGLIWNVRDESVNWVAELTEIRTPFAGDAPTYDSGDWRKVFPAQGFSPLQQASFPHTHCGPVEQVIIDRFLSVSYISALPKIEREAFANRLRNWAANHPDLEGRHEVIFPYITEAFCCQRIT